MRHEDAAAILIAHVLEAITWTPNEHGVVVLICRDCLMALLDDDGNQIPVDGPVINTITAGVTHVNLYHH